MPKDKKSRIRPVAQIIAGFGLLTALMLDHGCRADSEVHITEATPLPRTPVEPVKYTTTAPAGPLTMSAIAPTGAAQPARATHTTPVAQSPTPAATGFDGLLANDPLAALKKLHEDAAAAERSYTCLFTRQERLPGGIGPEQDVRVKFRAKPYSVAMEFVRNPDLVKRAIFVEDRWVDESASDPQLRDLALVQPHGVAGLLIKSLKQPIRGSMAQRSGRRAIDQFGFERAVGLLVEYSEKAHAAGQLKLDYEGEAEFEGQRVWVLRRKLPYTGDNGEYPDLIAVIYIDQARRIPIAIHTFNDERCRPEDLLGKYEYREIDFGANITDADFDPKTYGL